MQADLQTRMVNVDSATLKLRVGVLKGACHLCSALQLCQGTDRNEQVRARWPVMFLRQSNQDSRILPQHCELNGPFRPYIEEST